MNEGLSDSRNERLNSKERIAIFFTSLPVSQPHLSYNPFVLFCRLCQACRRPFNDPSVARYPNGVITHIHCARNKTVCPVTGHVFSSLEQKNEAAKDK